MLSENMIAAFVDNTLTKAERKEVMSIIARSSSQVLLGLNITAACCRLMRVIDPTGQV